ncbi:uncharacterized protein LAESUDRAFT_762185 [Laetiporus sulphureus 93-53]|uniref:Uncharacterized protein n=1 Tax=Laetiporus sulphureus 93-53 TaxID=1314785 RepID=A0A165CPX5_9APHY|nr:uncharacterized protein LAESUDRAFT_762185 [Laetiporus sulphureus 93-53]KZT03205.1 hypothetical protein LAESUDRAFT_762185 [Laetiporus sulphureus 93-53]
MGQYWMIINLDKREATSHLGKLGECLFDGIPESLVPYFAIPLPLSALDIKKEFSGVNSGPSANSALGSLDLAPEILYLIFDEIDDLRGAISLSLTNKTLSDIGQARVYELACKTTAPWAGDRVICAGDYMRWHDLPVGMLSESELYEYRSQDEDEGDGDSNEEYDSYTNNPRNFHDVRWREAPSRHSEPDVLNISSIHDAYFHYNVSSFEREEFSRRQKPQYSIDLSKDETHGWVLCSISKREYVRASVVAALTGSSAKMPRGIGGRGGFGLGHVLMSQICWSSDDSISMRYKGDLHRGRWAGDRLSITTMDRLDNHEAWKDTSEEVVKKITKIWDADCQGWRSQVNCNDTPK